MNSHGNSNVHKTSYLIALLYLWNLLITYHGRKPILLSPLVPLSQAKFLQNCYSRSNRRGIRVLYNPVKDLSADPSKNINTIRVAWKCRSLYHLGIYV
jgi:hypothetical protein